MKQLMMRWDKQPVKKRPLPKGFRIRMYREGDAQGWIRVCKSGQLGVDEAVLEDFRKDMLEVQGILPEGIFFIVNEKNEIVGTATGMLLSEGEKGCLHMVCIDPGYRGKGLSSALNSSVLEYLAGHGCRSAILRTDDFRIPAIRSYLSLGFKPILYAQDMMERWQKILCQAGRKEIDAYTEDGKTAGVIRACEF
jgi:mycothiol synthase